MATGTVLRPSQSSEARHSGIPLTFLAYLQRPLVCSLALPPSAGLAPASPPASLVEGPWWKSVVKDPVRPFQGKGAASLRRGSRWAHTCVCTHGHTPLFPFIVCELGLTLRRSDPLKTTSILLLGSSFSAKTEGYGKEKLKDFSFPFLKRKKKKKRKKAAGAQACNLRTL